MRSRHVGLLLGGLLMLAVLPAYGQQAQAWIVAFEGDVSVKMKDSTAWNPISEGTILFAGDTIQTGAEARATLLLQSARRVKMEANERFLVTADSTDLPTWIQRVIVSLFSKATPTSPGFVRGTKSDPPILLYPRYGKLLSARPTFVWLHALPRGASYQLHLANDHHELIWSSPVTRDSTLHYPDETEEPLQAGQTYTFEVKPLSTDESGSGSFTVATDAQRTATAQAWEDILSEYISTDPHDITALVVFAAYLFENEFYTDAYLALERARALQPNSPAVQCLFAQIYEWAGPRLLIPKEAD